MWCFLKLCQDRSIKCLTRLTTDGMKGVTGILMPPWHLHAFSPRTGTQCCVSMRNFDVNCCEVCVNCAGLLASAQRNFEMFKISATHNFRATCVNIAQPIRKHCGHCATYSQTLQAMRYLFANTVGSANQMLHSNKLHYLIIHIYIYAYIVCIVHIYLHRYIYKILYRYII